MKQYLKQQVTSRFVEK